MFHSRLKLPGTQCGKDLGAFWKRQELQQSLQCLLDACWHERRLEIGTLVGLVIAEQRKLPTIKFQQEPQMMLRQVLDELLK